MPDLFACHISCKHWKVFSSALLTWRLLLPSLCTALPDSDDFAFFHEDAPGCLGVQDHSLVMSSSCEEANQRWKWVTRGRLFNLGSSLCLGVTSGNLTSRGKSPLGVYTCDHEPPRVRWTWNCGQVLDNLNNYIPSPSSRNSSSPSKFKWTLHGGLQDLCAKTYRGKPASIKVFQCGIRRRLCML